VPSYGLRVLSVNDGLRIGGESMAGALVVPAYSPDGELQSLQLIPPAAKKMNLPGCPIGGALFAVGTIEPGGVAYICEVSGKHGLAGKQPEPLPWCALGWQYDQSGRRLARQR